MTETIGRIFDPTKPVTTRDGRPARIICTDTKGTNPIVALIMHRNGMETTLHYNPYGRWAGGSDHADLINVVVKTSTYQKVCGTGSSVLLQIGYHEFSCREDAEETTAIDHIGYIRRDYEDGVLVKTELENV